MVSEPISTGSELPPETEDPNICYPDTDGEPLAETEFQFNPLTEMVHALRVHYEDRSDVYVAGDMFVYYRMNDAGASVAPDVFAVFGVDKHTRRSYMVWREGKAPDFVMEIASEGTYDRDIGEKREIYMAIGVMEYWRFDPLRECFDPPLAGERLVSGRYEPIPVGEDADGILRGYSALLGLDICVVDDLLRLYDPIDRNWLRNLSEAEAARTEAEAARTEAEAARTEAETTLQASEERNRALEALLRQHGISPDSE
jgi:Uma2 family endonuclease